MQINLDWYDGKDEKINNFLHDIVKVCEKHKLNIITEDHCDPICVNDNLDFLVIYNAAKEFYGKKKCYLVAADR